MWVNTNKTILEERFVKIPCSDFPKDYNYLKFIWIHTKKEDRVLIKNCSREYKEIQFLYQLINISMEGLWRNMYWVSH